MNSPPLYFRAVAPLNENCQITVIDVLKEFAIYADFSILIRQN